METSLAALANRQLSLFTRRQARACGMSDKQVDAGTAAAWWRRVENSVFLMAGVRYTWRHQVMAKCLAAGDGAVATSVTGARLFNASGATSKEIHLLVPADRRPRVKGAVIHRSSEFPSKDRTSIDGIPVAHPARLLCDMARSATERELEEAVDDFIIRGVTGLGRVARRLDELSGAGHNGCALLRKVLSTWDDDMPEQTAEMRLIRRLVAGGLPRPEAQMEVRDDAGRFIGRVDVGWRWAMAGFELKSKRWHGTPSGVAYDVRRDNAFKAHGWTILDATPADLRGSGAHLVEAAAQVLARAMV